MTNWYVPLAVPPRPRLRLRGRSRSARASLVGPKRYNRAKLDAYECGIEPTPQRGRRRPLPGQVLPHRDALHRLRHRDHLPLPVRRRLRPARASFALVEMVLFIVTVFVAYAYVWRRGGLTGTEREPDHGHSRRSCPSGFLLTTVEKLAGYMRKSSLWPATFGLACCAIEMMAVGAADYDLARFGMEVFRATPAPGRPDDRGRPGQPEDGPGAAPDLRPDGRAQVGHLDGRLRVSSGGMFNNYAIVQGVDHVVPVDIYLPGCPPRPEMLIDAILTLHDRSRTCRSASTASQGRPRAPSDAALRAPPPTQPDEGPARVMAEPRPRPDAGRAPEHADPHARPRSSEVRRLPRRRRAPPPVQVARRTGMFGVRGTGDTSGYGGLTRTVAMPGGSSAAVRRLVDEVADALEPRARRRRGVRRRRREGRRRPRRDHLLRAPRAPRRGRPRCCATTRGCASSSASGVSGVHYPRTTGPRAARGLPPALDDPQPPDPRSRSPPPTPTRTSRRRRDLPDRRLARARDLRHVRHRLRRPPRPDPHPDARRLAGPPAAQGLPARRHPGRVQGRAPSHRPTSGGRTTDDRHDSDRRARTAVRDRRLGRDQPRAASSPSPAATGTTLAAGPRGRARRARSSSTWARSTPRPTACCG